MKHLHFQFFKVITFVAISFFLVSCVSQKDYITDSDYSYTGKFKKYKTFHFTKLSENDSLILKDLLEKTIVEKMDAQGYDFKSYKPDILITYKIYIDDFKMKGYDQPQIEHWVYNDYGDKVIHENGEPSHIETPPSANMNAEYNERNYSMQQGTLLITFFDTKRKKIVWQGYASGVFSSRYDSPERSVKLATSKIFNEFRLVANGYVSKRGA